MRERAVRRRWSQMRWFISAFSESDEGEGAWVSEVRLVRRWIRRSRSAFTTSDMVGEGVESREETRMGEEERDMLCCEDGQIKAAQSLSFYCRGTGGRWEFDDGAAVVLYCQSSSRSGV